MEDEIRVFRAATFLIRRAFGVKETPEKMWSLPTEKKEVDKIILGDTKEEAQQVWNRIWEKHNPNKLKE